MPSLSSKDQKENIICTMDGKVQVGNDQKMAQSERNSSIIRELGKTKMTLRYLNQENIS